MTRLPDHPEYPMYSEAVKELHGLASHELRRLAMRYADYFFVCLHCLYRLINSNNQFLTDFL
jgi:hypothetical protein